jgi:hypothetical protein
VAAKTITEIIGKPKRAGKTRFVAGMVRKVIDGAAFLDFPTTKTNVVWLSEQPMMSLQEILKSAGLYGRPELTVVERNDVIGVSWKTVVEVVLQVAEERQAELLIVDTIAPFAGIHGDAENNSGSALEALDPLHGAVSKGITVIVVRHERKMGGVAGDSGRGSSAFTGDVDNSITLRRPPGDTGPDPRVREITTVGRFSGITPDQLFIELDKDGEYVNLGPEANYATSSATNAIRAILTPDSRAEYTEDELCKATDTPRSTVKRALKELEARGEIERVGAGKRNDATRYRHANGFCPPIEGVSGQKEPGDGSETPSDAVCVQRHRVRSGQKQTGSRSGASSRPRRPASTSKKA